MMKCLKKSGAMLIMILFMVVIVCPVTVNATTMQTTALVNMRSGASMKYSVRCVVKKGTLVTYQSKKGNWVRVKLSNGKTGYISAKYLKTIAEKLYATVGNLHVRTGKGTKYKSIAVVKKGYAFTKIQKYGNWTKVKMANGKVGYVSSKYLTTKKPVTTSTVNKNVSVAPLSTNSEIATIQKKAIEYCKSRVGDVYSQSKRDQTGYADCSSLQRDAFLYAAKVMIGDTTYDQKDVMKAYFYKINTLADVAPGDLVYRFGETSNHVALYLGDGNVIHASGSDKCVCIKNYGKSSTQFQYGCRVGQFCLDHR